MVGSNHSEVCRNKTFDAAEHLVVFLDFLGMSGRMLDKDMSEYELSAWAKELDELISELTKQSKAILDGRTLIRGFSDCFVIARPWCLNETCLRRNRDWLKLRIARLQIMALLKGYLLRGAASCGLFVAGKFAMLGEALVCSYRLEMNSSIFPRVIIDQNLASRLPELERHFLRDKDGFWFVDFLRVSLEDENRYDVDEALNAILGMKPSESIRLKHEWLRDYAIRYGFYRTLV